MSALSFAKPSSNFDDKLAATQTLLRSSVQQYPRITQANSLGAEDLVITHLLHQLNLLSLRAPPSIDVNVDAPQSDAGPASPVGASVFVLQTGQLHAQTLALIPQIESRYGIVLNVFEPVQAQAIEFVQRHGAKAMYQSMNLRKTCCDIRKMRPLAQALSGQQAWITGLRREQSNNRAEVVAVAMEALPPNVHPRTRAKITPLVDWTWGDVWHFIALEGIAYNPLHDEFFPSIGCAPCTRAIALGEDFRAGRWWWEDETAKECGLHVKPANLSTDQPKESA
jgi:phosphoadenosine phosphosulfate reductase